MYLEEVNYNKEKDEVWIIFIDRHSSPKFQLMLYKEDAWALADEILEAIEEK